MRWWHHVTRSVDLSQMAFRWRWVRPFWIGCNDAGYGRSKAVWSRIFIAREYWFNFLKIQAPERNLGEFVEMNASQAFFLGRWCFSTILPDDRRTLLANYIGQGASFRG